jgi:hypothetical protein
MISDIVRDFCDFLAQADLFLPGGPRYVELARTLLADVDIATETKDEADQERASIRDLGRLGWDGPGWTVPLMALSKKRATAVLDFAINENLVKAGQVLDPMLFLRGGWHRNTVEEFLLAVAEAEMPVVNQSLDGWETISSAAARLRLKDLVDEDLRSFVE